MSYMDEKDKAIQERMKQEGKVIVPNFEEMVKNHFKSKYNKEGYFAFLYVEYEFYDKDYKIFNLNIGDYVSKPQNRKIKTLFPFFIEEDAINDIKTFSLKIPGIIDINNLSSEISNRVPDGVTLISDNQINETLLEAGYEKPFFDHYYYSPMDYPGYNLYANPIVKTDAMNNQSPKIM